MTNRERYESEIKPYVLEGLIREVFKTDEFSITCIANSAYSVNFYELRDEKTNLTWGFNIRGPELEMLMESPTRETFKVINYASQQKKEKRAFLLTPALAQKFRELKAKLDAQNKIEVDMELEQRLVAEAKQKQADATQKRM